MANPIFPGSAVRRRNGDGHVFVVISIEIDNRNPQLIPVYPIDDPAATVLLPRADLVWVPGYKAECAPRGDVVGRK